MVLMLVLLHMFSIYATKLKFTAAQGRRVEFKSVGLVPEGVVGYAVVLTKKNCFSTDGQLHFDLL